MDNLFENASFGDKYQTRCGKSALFIKCADNEENKLAIFYVENLGLISVFQGSGLLFDIENGYDIIAR
jgi:hypothetical protein